MLVVDDLDRLREMVSDFLKSLRIEVLEASSASEAIQIARSHAGTIELLLTDLELPRMSGWGSAKKIATLRPGIRILFISAGISAQEWQDHDQEPTGVSFIQKPFSLEKLNTPDGYFCRIRAEAANA